MNKSETGSLGTTLLTFNIENGQVNFFASMFAVVGCGNGRFLECISSVDFSASARFLGATVLDEFGNTVAAPSITSASGFDYVTGAQPHTPAVPLPAGAWLLLSGIVTLGAALRRRKQH